MAVKNSKQITLKAEEKAEEKKPATTKTAKAVEEKPTTKTTKVEEKKPTTKTAKAEVEEKVEVEEKPTTKTAKAVEEKPTTKTAKAVEEKPTTKVDVEEKKPTTKTAKAEVEEKVVSNVVFLQSDKDDNTEDQSVSSSENSSTISIEEVEKAYVNGEARLDILESFKDSIDEFIHMTDEESLKVFKTLSRKGQLKVIKKLSKKNQPIHAAYLKMISDHQYNSELSKVAAN
jgi:hypothetical protein